MTMNTAILVSMLAFCGEMPALPRGVASMGAIAHEGHLYVYGGHCGTTHKYDTESVLGTFHRLRLDGGKSWEPLPGGPILQGMNLAGHGGKIYRIGGMQPRNKPGEAADTLSVATCERFDIGKGAWESMPSLPSGRSSHDVVVAGNHLVVVGGWEMKGAGKEPAWHETALILDLNNPGSGWQAIPQPFRRRALTAAAVGTKVFVLGGLGADGQPTEVLDVETRTWAKAPALPKGGKNSMAFSPAATTLGGRVLVNMADGPVYQLNQAGDGWKEVARLSSPRMVARMVPFGESSVLVVAGASRKGGNLATLEVVSITGQPGREARGN